jgi:hypothetical protein
VATISGATDIITGFQHACAIADGGRTLCWGGGTFVGDGTPQSRPVPTAVKW